MHLTEVESKLKEIQNESDSFECSFADLIEYFGEDSTKTTTQQIFSTLNVFIRKFQVILNNFIFLTLWNYIRVFFGCYLPFMTYFCSSRTVKNAILCKRVENWIKKRNSLINFYTFLRKLIWKIKNWICNNS